MQKKMKIKCKKKLKLNISRHELMLDIKFIKGEADQ